MFDADRPIQKSDQDRLGRTLFAKYLARCMLDHKTPESLVIGLYGGWGSGKTSLINLILEELRFASSNMFDDERPIILNFSPWSYSGQGQLIYSFFRRLSSEIRRFEFLPEADKNKIIHLLELYVSFFTHKPVPQSLRPKHNWLTKLFKRERNRQETYGWESGRDLTLIKAELNTILAAQKHKIIIIIDNISRIEDAEIKQIFQIVKSMGDYFNTIYLLSCDKEQVTNALNNLQPNSGEEYLEKIVQLPFEIPPISRQDLENILLDRLKSIVDLIPEEAWNKEYWADIYYSLLKNFFENCRDISRYVNALNFNFLHVKDVVNPVDFFAITAIRVFEPAVYYGIRDNKDLFTDLIENVYHLDTNQVAKDKSRCDEILNRAQKLPRDVLEQLLIRLFPRLRSLYEANLPFYHSEALARKNLRICSPDTFDVYFRLSIPSGFIPESEMRALLAEATDKETFSEELARLNHDDKMPLFLDQLDGSGVIEIATKNIPNVVSALMDDGDLFVEGENSPLRFNTPMRLHRIFHQLLMRFPSTEERFAILQNAIKSATKSLYIIVHEISEHEREHNEIEDTYVPIEHRDLTPQQLRDLKKCAVEQIVKWATMGRLVEHPRLLPILYAWKAWGDDDACKQYVMQIAETDRGLLAFLCAAFKEPIDQALINLEKNPDWIKHLKNVEDFISPTLIENHAKELFEDLYFEKLREREQLALLIFLDCIKADTVKVIPKTTV